MSIHSLPIVPGGCLNARSKGVLVFLLKALVTAGCLWWLSGYFDYEQVRSALSGVNPLLLVTAVGLHFLSFLAGGVRWWMLFKHLSGPIPARLYAAGMRGGALVSSAFVDRVLGLASIISMGLFALIFAPADFENDLAAGVFGMSLIILLMVFMLAALPRCARYIDSGFGSRWPRIHSILECFPRYRDAPGLILGAFGLSVLNQLLVVLVFILLAPGLGVDLPVFQFIVVLILVFLVASLPISLGGLGAREGAMMTLLLPLGVEPASVLALSMAYLLVLWSCTLPGAFMLLLKEPEATDAAT